MLGIGPVMIGGVQMYAYFVQVVGHVRLRLWADEADQLDLLPGRSITLGLPDVDVEDVLVAATRREPPFVWLEMETFPAKAA